MQARLEDRIYTSVSAFSADLSEIFEAAVAPKKSAGTCGDSLQNEARNIPTLDAPALDNPKESKKVAKRLLRALEPLLQESIRKEAELSGKPFEKELKKIERLLGRSLTGQTHDVSEREDVLETKDNVEIPNGAIYTHGELSVGPSTSAQEDVQPILTRANQKAEANEAHLGDSKYFGTEANETTLNGGNESGQQSTLYNDNHGPTNVTSPVLAGGIPWYLNSFDPSGTSMYEERWSGREVIRGMSEDLSEIDEDELQGLEEGIADQGDKRSPAKKRKRKKSFW